jgi:putative ABC transport system permease protein
MSNLWQDLRYAVRVLAKSPGVTGVVLLSLALGIGANVAVFSLLSAVVLKTLPVPHPEELVQFSETGPRGAENSAMSYPYFERVRDRNQTLSGVFAFSPLDRVNVGFDGNADWATGQVATGSYFSTLGLEPAAGQIYLYSG